MRPDYVIRRMTESRGSVELRRRLKFGKRDLTIPNRRCRYSILWDGFEIGRIDGSQTFSGWTYEVHLLSVIGGMTFTCKILRHGYLSHAKDQVIEFFSELEKVKT